MVTGLLSASTTAISNVYVALSITLGVGTTTLPSFAQAVTAICVSITGAFVSCAVILYVAVVLLPEKSSATTFTVYSPMSGKRTSVAPASSAVVTPLNVILSAYTLTTCAQLSVTVIAEISLPKSVYKPVSTVLSAIVPNTGATVSIARTLTVSCASYTRPSFTCLKRTTYLYSPVTSGVIPPSSISALDVLG